MKSQAERGRWVDRMDSSPMAALFLLISMRGLESTARMADGLDKKTTGLKNLLKTEGTGGNAMGSPC